VVRWLLNSPGGSGGSDTEEGFYNSKKDSDLIFKYSTNFKYKGKENGLLTSIFIDYDLFFNQNIYRDLDSCFLIKKRGCNRIIHPVDSINIQSFTSDWEKMANIFNRCKYFYCYDNECFWVTLAALCGCIPIVIPNTDKSSSQWKIDFPWTKYGVAYGEEEINWAISTSHLVKSNFLEIEKQNLKTVSNMIELCDLL
jgi:hypothetical protein